MKRRRNTLAILGAGNLGQAIAGGAADSGLFAPDQVTLTRRKTDTLEPFRTEGYTVTDDNRQAVRESDVLLLSVEPTQLKGLLSEIRSDIDPSRHLLLSVIAGVETSEIVDMIESEPPVIRAAPNTAVSIRESMTCISSRNGEPDGLELARKLFSSMGSVRVIDEELMPAATALCASGIAFYMRAIRAATEAGVEAGFTPEDARLMAIQTARGAASLLLETGRHPEEEIDRVTTPGGCTISGLNRMEERGFSSALTDGILHAARKAKKLT